MKPHYAIIRHEKVKDGRHLVATGLHNMRALPTANADPDAPHPVKVLIGSRKPWRDVRTGLDRLGIGKIRKRGNVAFEVLLATSPEYWTAKGWEPGKRPSPELQAAIDAWVAAQLEYARKRFGHLLVSAVLHLDERSPHMHLLVIPAQYRADGRAKGEDKGQLAWRLSAEQMIKGPSHLKEIVSEYAQAMAHFGLVRGEDREPGTAKHKPAKVWQAEQAEAAVVIGETVMEQTRIKREAEILKKEMERMSKESEEEAQRVLREARIEAARMLAASIRKEEERVELERAVEAERRRKEDDAARARELRINADAEAIRAERVKLDAEWDTVHKMKAKLQSVLDQAEILLKPIIAMASEWRRASPIVKQALGLKGKKAVEIADSMQVQTLIKMGARGREG